MAGKVRRAPTLGRRTRNISATFKKSKVRPLPASLAVHPQKAERLPQNPGCMTRRPNGITAYLLRDGHSLGDVVREALRMGWIHDGSDPAKPCTYKVTGMRLLPDYFTGDPVVGLGVARAMGATLETGE